MKVKWTPLARKHLRHTANYIQTNEGSSSYETFADNVIEWQEILSRMPEVGSPEPLLLHRSIPSRSIVINRLNKLIYHIADDLLIIDDFWDTRREPKGLAEKLK